MIKNGTIPKNITIVSNGSTKAYRHWEDLGQEVGEEDVIPAFAADTSSKNMVETAKSWAANKGSYVDGRWTVRNQVKTEEKENSQITGVKILGLEYRGNGGRAYKVVTPDGYYFDLREDVLLDTLVNEGVSKGGILVGSFVWGRVGSQMKLVRVGSKLYNALNESDTRHNLKKVSVKSFKVGGLYEDKKGDKAIFLGWVSTIKVHCTTNHNNYHNNNYTYTFSTKDIPKGMLFWKHHNYNKKPPLEEFNSWLEKDEYLYSVCIKSSHTFVREVEVCPVPSQIISIISNKAIENSIRNYENDRYYNQNNDRRYSTLSHHSDLINMIPHGSILRMHPVFNGMRTQ